MTVSVPPFVLEETQYIWRAVIALVNSRHEQSCEEKAKQPVDSSWLPLFNFPVTFMPSGNLVLTPSNCHSVCFFKCTIILGSAVSKRLTGAKIT